MKAVFRFLICLVLAAACPVFLPSSASAGDEGPAGTSSPVYIDCSTDQSAYGETVARLNRATEQISAGQEPEPGTVFLGGAEPLYTVLCQTDGASVSFESWAPVCVVSGPSGCCTLYFDDETAADKAAAELSLLPRIRYAERDARIEACESPAPVFHSWGAESMAFGSYLRYAGGVASGSVTVAVVDSGVYLHPLYSDRVPESGYDYVDGDEDSLHDPFGHGTNVCGIVADCTQGFQVLFYPIRVLNAEGTGRISNAVNGIREAVERGVDVINLSLATKNKSAALDAAVLDALKAGITVVAAAGNGSRDTAQVSPANLTDPGVIVVGGAEADGTRSPYSNYGSSVDLFAYGSHISCCSNTGGYKDASGTSMAAPHITGLASLLILSHGGIAPDEIEARIRLSTGQAEAVNIPNLIRSVPDHPGFSLTCLNMDLHDCIPLPRAVRPLTAMEELSYWSSDASVVSTEDGGLIPHRPGIAVIVARCPGLADSRFLVRVRNEKCAAVSLPPNVRIIEEGAFWGDASVSHVVLPDGCESVAEDAFGMCRALKTIRIPAALTDFSLPSFSGAVVLCPQNEETEENLLRRGIPYIALS